MDVQCERCQAEYEFDDALISGRGTTVKCTSCGHQFRLKKGSAGLPDRWRVRNAHGKEFVFTSLRELQRAIVAREVGRYDTLSRGDAAARPLGSIAELEPFFEEAAGRSWSPAGDKANEPARGKSAPPKKSSRPPPPLGGRTPPTLRPIASSTPAPAATHPASVPLQLASPLGAMRPRIDTIRPPSNANAAVPPPIATTPRLAGEDVREESGSRAPVSVAPVLNAGLNAGFISQDIGAREPPHATLTAADRTPPMPMHASDHPPAIRPAAKTLMHAPPSPAPPAGSHSPPAPPKVVTTPLPTKTLTTSPPPPRAASAPPPPTIKVETESNLPPPTVPVRVEPPRVRARAQGAVDSSGDLDEEIASPSRPRRVGGWIAAFVLIVGAGVIGFAVAKPYLDAKARREAAASSAIDPRAAQFLADGEKALAEGDLDAANDAFVKASALAEKDARVLTDLARLANARADVAWLRVLVLPSTPADDARAAQAQLTELGAKAKNAAAAAAAVAPDEPSSTLAQIDALRITGDRTAARALVPKVMTSASQPDTAYSLAALDMAESEPLWPMVIERLRLAVVGEGNAGRARAALVYALARSDDAAGAKVELDKLAGSPRPYPLVGVLRSFVGKMAAESRDAGAPAGKVAASGPTQTHGGPTAPGEGAGKTPAGGGGGGGGGNGHVSYSGANDPRFLIAQAESAKSSHDYERARALYSSALAQNPSDSEALAGIGDVNRAAHDLPGAADYYKRALAVNPVYLPALIGLGDVEWDSGDRDEAQRTYHDITERFPDGTYPARVGQRANDMSGGVSTPSTAPTATATAHAGAAPSDSASASPAASSSADPTGGAP